MQGEVRIGVFSFALCFTVASTTGCSSDSEPVHREMPLGCATDLDCSSIGSGSRCESGMCLLPPMGSGGSGGGLPAQGAVVESIAPTPGSSSGCLAASAPFFAPPNSDPVSGTAQTLMCDVSVPGCKPSANVVVDGDAASVSCTVTNVGDSFNVSATLSNSNVGFNIQGTLTAVGGKAFVSSSHDQHNFQDKECDITLEPNQGELKPGAIWAAFNCTAFGDPSTGEFGCTASGKFLFENCDK